MKRTPKAAALLFAALLPCLGAPVFAEGETQEAVPLTGEKIYGSTAQLLRQALSNHPSGRKP